MGLTALALATTALDLTLQALGERPLHAQPTALTLAARLCNTVFHIVLLEQVWRLAPLTERWVLKPAWIGLSLMAGLEVYVASESLLFARLSEQASRLQALGLLVLSPLMAWTLHRLQGRPLRLRISHAAAFYSTSLLLVGGYLMLVAAVGSYIRYFGGQWGDAMQVLLMLVALGTVASVALSSPLRSRLRVLVSKHFFQYRYDYREEWLKFTAHLAAAADPRDVGNRVLDGLAGMVQAGQGLLMVRNREGQMKALAQHQWSAPADDGADSSEPLEAFLQRTQWVIDLEEWRQQPAHYGDLALPLWLTQHPDARLVVPLSTAGTLVGYAVLGPPIRGLSVNWEVRDLLKTAAAQAGSYLVQMQATEQLLEARKFEAFNRMSAFVVHDIKNIVTQLALMTRNAQRLGDNPEFRADMIETVDQSVEKMRRLLVQLREGTPAADSALGGVELQPLLRRLQLRAQARGREVAIHRSEHLATRGDAARLERVLGHLVDNALDATPAGQAVWLELWRESGSVCVAVSDEGPGMSEAFVRDRLFRPFETTKATGMGIGLHESLQYVRELGGRLEVNSREGHGTRITAHLPVLEIEARAALVFG